MCMIVVEESRNSAGISRFCCLLPNTTQTGNIITIRALTSMSNGAYIPGHTVPNKACLTIGILFVFYGSITRPLLTYSIGHEIVHRGVQIRLISNIFFSSFG